MKRFLYMLCYGSSQWGLFICLSVDFIIFWNKNQLDPIFFVFRSTLARAGEIYTCVSMSISITAI